MPTKSVQEILSLVAQHDLKKDSLDSLFSLVEKAKSVDKKGAYASYYSKTISAILLKYRISLTTKTPISPSKIAPLLSKIKDLRKFQKIDLDQEAVADIFQILNSIDVKQLSIEDISSILFSLSSIGFCKEILAEIFSKKAAQDPKKDFFVEVANLLSSVEIFSRGVALTMIHALTHLKNLGYLGEEGAIISALKLFDFLAEKKISFQDEADKSRICELYLHLRHVHGVEFEEDVESVMRQNIALIDVEISASQKEVAQDVVKFLENFGSWKHVASRKEGGAAEISDFRFLTEFSYAKIGDRDVRSADIAVLDSDGKEVAVIEFDGPHHFVKFGEIFYETGKTKARNELLCSIFSQDRVLAIPFEMAKSLKRFKKDSEFLSPEEIKIKGFLQKLSEIIDRSIDSQIELQPAEAALESSSKEAHQEQKEPVKEKLRQAPQALASAALDRKKKAPTPKTAIAKILAKKEFSAFDCSQICQIIFNCDEVQQKELRETNFQKDSNLLEIAINGFVANQNDENYLSLIRFLTSFGFETAREMPISQIQNEERREDFLSALGLKREIVAAVKSKKGGKKAALRTNSSIKLVEAKLDRALFLYQFQRFLEKREFDALKLLVVTKAEILQENPKEKDRSTGSALAVFSLFAPADNIELNKFVFDLLIKCENSAAIRYQSCANSVVRYNNGLLKALIEYNGDILQGMDMNNGMSLLVQALMCNNEEAARFLVSKDCIKIDLSLPLAADCLFSLAGQGVVWATELILEYYVLHEDESKKKETHRAIGQSLLCAIQKDEKESFDILLAHCRKNADLYKDLVESAMGYLCAQKDPRYCKYVIELLDAGLSRIVFPIRDRASNLLDITLEGSQETLNAVLERCSPQDLITVGSNGIQPLFLAITTNKFEEFVAISNKLDGLNKFYSQDSPLFVAIKTGNMDFLDKILALDDLDINLARPEDGVSALCLACKLEKPEAVERLLKRGAILRNEDSEFGHKQDALFFCATNKSPKSMEKLLIGGAKPDGVVLQTNITPLYFAVDVRFYECAKILIKYGADPNIASIDTKTSPLMLACKPRNPDAIKSKSDQMEDVEFVKILVESGKCNIDQRDAKGRTASYYALESSNCKSFAFLLLKGANKDFVKEIIEEEEAGLVSKGKRVLFDFLCGLNEAGLAKCVEEGLERINPSKHCLRGAASMDGLRRDLLGPLLPISPRPVAAAAAPFSAVFPEGFEDKKPPKGRS